MTDVFGRSVPGREVAPSLALSADVAIVGGGAAGITMASALAQAGLRVVVLEEGPSDEELADVRIDPFRLADVGARRTEDGEIHLVQGRGIGGSLTTGINACRRIPRGRLRLWESRYGIDLKTLEADLDRAEALLEVAPIPPDEVNANNARLWAGMRRLGYRGGPLFHAGIAASGSATLAARLLEGPYAEQVAIITSAQVDQILHSGSLAQAVVGTLKDPNRVQPVGQFKINARAVVLAASAVGSAALVLRSKLPDPAHEVGARLHTHPRATVLAYYPEPVAMWRGRASSIECSELLGTTHDAPQRVWIVSDAVSHAEAAAMIPGFGPDHAREMMRLPYAAATRVVVRDRAVGRVQLGVGDRTRVVYPVPMSEREQLALGIREAARIHLAAGASEVLVHGGPGGRVSSEDALEAITGELLERVPVPLSSPGPSSTLRTHRDPAEGVCDPMGRHHYAPNVYVADGAAFPTAVGVPLLLPSTAWSLLVSRAVIGDLV